MNSRLRKVAKILATASLLIGARGALAGNVVCPDEAFRKIHGSDPNQLVVQLRALGSGDVDGDGETDLLVGDGTTLRVFTDADTGGTHVTDDPSRPSIEFPLPPYAPYISVATAAAVGDINDDGYADIVAVSDTHAWAYLGPFPSAPAVVTGAEIVLHGSTWRAIAGRGDAIAVGDVNADGADDIVLGDAMQGRPPYSWIASDVNPFDDPSDAWGNGDMRAGQVHVIFGRTAWSQSMTPVHYQLDCPGAPVTIPSGYLTPDINFLGAAGFDNMLGFGESASGDNFGWDVVVANVDFCDGYPDILIGAPGYQDVAASDRRGAVYVVHGGPSIPTGCVDMRSSAPFVMSPGSDRGTSYGVSLDWVASANGLGGAVAGTLLVGADTYARLGTGSMVGRAFLHPVEYAVGTCEPYVACNTEIRGNTPYGHLGFDVKYASLSTPGGSAFVDVVVSEPWPYPVYDQTQGPGRVHVLCQPPLCSSTDNVIDLATDPINVTTIEGERSGDAFGTELNWVQSPNGVNDFSYLGITAPGYDGPAGDAGNTGGAYFFPGEECKWCNDPPGVAVSGPITLSCGGALSVPVSATVTNDPGETTTITWTTDCSNGAFANEHAASTTLSFTSESCAATCTATATVSDCRHSIDHPCDACTVCQDTITITVHDGTDPVLAGVPANVTVACDAVPVPASVTATDTCDASPAVSMSEVRTNGACPSSYTLVRTWTATDDCGNDVSQSQTITVADTVAPTLSGVPADLTVQCHLVPAPAAVTATDACDPSVVPVFVETRVDGACAHAYTLNRKWTATDDCGNAVTGTQVVTVVDTVAPTLVGVPADTTAACDAIPDPPTVTATDNCSPPPSVVFSQFRIPGPCSHSYTLRRRWYAKDECQNETIAWQDVTVTDDQPPVLAGVPADATVDCDAVPPPATPTASDSCDLAPVVNFSESAAPGSCPQEKVVTRTWTATDACGNSASDSQVLTVVDNDAPALSGVPADATVSCDAVPPPATVTATDTCDPNPAVTLSVSEVPGSCPQAKVITRTWTATDACGNSASDSQVLTVVDLSAPTLAGVPAHVVVQCDAVPAPAAVTATDTCDPAPTVTMLQVRTNGSCENEYTLTRTWTAVDHCGNSTSSFQTITVHDTVAPSVTADGDVAACLWPPNHDYVCFDASDFAPVVGDNCPGAISWEFADCASDQPVNGPGDGNTVDDCTVAVDGQSFCVRSERSGNIRAGRHYTVSIVATDACGNASSPTTIGVIYVPHDQRDVADRDCISPND